MNLTRDTTAHQDFEILSERVQSACGIRGQHSGPQIFSCLLKFSSSFVSLNIHLETYLKLVVGPHGQKNLSNPHPSCGAVGFAIGTPHSGLEPISSSTGQHFVDPKHVERMDTNPAD